MSRIAGKRRTRPQPPGVTERIDFDGDEIAVAMQWHGGQSSMLYAIGSTGALSRGTDRPRTECDVCGGFKWECPKCYGHGQPMSDVQWLVHLAAELSGEANDAADDARDQGLADDAATLDAIAAKCDETITRLGGAS